MQFNLYLFQILIHLLCIPSLNGDNYDDWKEKNLLTLGCMNLDLAHRIDESAIPTESSTQIEKASYERWERSNRLSLMFIKSSIRKSIRDSILECAKVKEYLKAIEQQFKTFDKALENTLTGKMCSMKFDCTKGIHEHTMKMRDIATHLKSL